MTAARRRPVQAGLLALLLAACTPAPQPRVDGLLVFGSQAELQTVGADDAAVDAALLDIGAALAEMQQQWHVWEPGPLKEINAAIASGAAAVATPSIEALIARAQSLAPQTDHLFDPAAGGLVALWGFHTGEFPIRTEAPTPEAIAAWLAAAPRIGDVRVVDGRVFSRNRAVQLDFGGMSEGMAIERLRPIMARHGLHNLLLTMGGDLFALGDAGGRPWRAGLRDPYGGVLGTVELRDGESLFSSGNYNKFRESPDGGRWPHILDPRTGHPVRGTAAVAVLHRDPVLADVGSTALFVAGPARFAELSQRLGLRCALMLTEENELLISAGMEARITLHRDPVRLGPPIGEPGPCDGG